MTPQFIPPPSARTVLVWVVLGLIGVAFWVGLGFLLRAIGAME